MKRLVTARIAIGALLVFGASTAFAFQFTNQVGFGQKMKAQKLQSDLVPAFACDPTDSDPGCSNSFLVGGGGIFTTNPAPGNQTKSAKSGNNCTFLTGTVKMQVGKDTQVQLKGVSCGSPGVVKDGGSLCCQTVGYSTLSNVLIDKKGAVTEIMPCGPTQSGFIQGSSNYTMAIVANTVGPCKKGTCKGVLSSSGQQSQNPCPHSDTISETRRIEIFDGDKVAMLPAFGTTLEVCCGLNQQIIPGVAVDEAHCPTPQDVLAVPGSLSRGTP